MRGAFQLAAVKVTLAGLIVPSAGLLLRASALSYFTVLSLVLHRRRVAKT